MSDSCEVAMDKPQPKTVPPAKKAAAARGGRGAGGDARSRSPGIVA
jgi:hypothetical protein